MNRHEQKRVRDWLSPNASLPNSLVFSPLEDWSNDEVWFYLMQHRNPWGRSNKDLMSMYRGASADNECPLVVDTSTPSCGSSRFGCWVCTLVSSDKSMQAMIQNDEEKSWMTPLLQFRDDIGRLNEIGYIDDRDQRDYRRMNGLITLHRGRAVHGPYTKERREDLLRRLLETQEQVRAHAPADVVDLRLIADEELCEIRRIWVAEKHEFDDALPRIYQDATGAPYPHLDRLTLGPFGKEEWDILADIAGSDYVFLDLQASLLDVEQRASGLGSPKAVVQELERQIGRCYYTNEDDAVAHRERQLKLRGLTSEQLAFAVGGERGVGMEPV
jgi:DNA sulfur modification protein DndC